MVVYVSTSHEANARWLIESSIIKSRLMQEKRMTIRAQTTKRKDCICSGLVSSLELLLLCLPDTQGGEG